jgi:hypothetical protein
MGNSKRTGLRARLQNLQRQQLEQTHQTPPIESSRQSLAGGRASTLPREEAPRQAAPSTQRPAAAQQAPVREERAVTQQAKPPRAAAPAKPRSVGFDAGAWIMTISVTAAMVYGWQNRAEGHLTAEKGVGYWLGIVGGSLMLLLLLYPLRKKYRSWRILGSVPAWFRLHMILGVIGPALIMYHCNFKLGSTNSNLALYSMLIVAGSGIIGRYLYKKIHLGLYGEKLKIREMIGNAQSLMDEVSHYVVSAPGVLDEMKIYEQKALKHPESLFGSLWGLISTITRSGSSRRRLIRVTSNAIKADAKAQSWSASVRRARLAGSRGRLNQYFALVNKAAKLAFYERLFALWHILHLPLFFVLILTTIVHIVAVHLY